MAQLFDKDRLQIKRIEKNTYTLEEEFSNLKVDIKKLLMFQNFPILRELYQDIIDEINVTNIQDDSATYFIVFKHFFKDMGFPRMGFHLDIKKTVKNNMLEFVCFNNNEIKENKIKESNHFILSFDTFIVQIYLHENNAKIMIQNKINLHFEIEPFVEKMVIQIIHKMFLRLKRFIEI